MIKDTELEVSVTLDSVSRYRELTFGGGYSSTLIFQLPHDEQPHDDLLRAWGSRVGKTWTLRLVDPERDVPDENARMRAYLQGLVDRGHDFYNGPCDHCGAGALLARLDSKNEER